MEFPELKNDLLLRALKGETVERPPVWMMRQAGRFLPDYRVLRENTPSLNAVKHLIWFPKLPPCPSGSGSDAAILFSDILVVPVAMGYQVDMVPV